MKEQIEAAERIIDRLRAEVPVVAAFWVKPADGRRWTLYLATEWANSLNDEARRWQLISALRSASAGENCWGDFGFLYQLVRPDSKTVRAVLDLHRRYPQLIPMWYNELMLGDLPIESAYLYPLPAVVASAA